MKVRIIRAALMSDRHWYRLMVTAENIGNCENTVPVQPYCNAHACGCIALTLSVGEVEEETQGEQQRQQQQRGSGSVHGGTAWHQHALAASVALAHRAL